MTTRALALLLTLVLTPLVAQGQPSGRAPRIGWLTSSVVHTANVEAFQQGMAQLGHRDVQIEFRAAARADQLIE